MKIILPELSGRHCIESPTQIGQFLQELLSPYFEVKRTSGLNP